MDRLHQKAESALELLNDGFGKDGEVNIWVLVEQEFGKLGDAFSVGVGLESKALGFEEGLQFFVVGDDTIVNDSELPLGVRPITICQLASKSVEQGRRLPMGMAIEP